MTTPDPITPAEMSGLVAKVLHTALHLDVETEGERGTFTTPATGQRFGYTIREVGADADTG